MTEKERYEKFIDTKQEKLRLKLCLEGFFEGEDKKHEAEYLAYIKRRIRPAAYALLEKDEADKLEILERLGVIGEREVEYLLKSSVDEGKIQCFVWLVGIKAEKYGFNDRDFTL